MEKIVLQVDGMSCGHCATAVKNLLQEVEGVQGCSVDLETRTANVDVDTNIANRSLLVKTVNDSEIYTAK